MSDSKDPADAGSLAVDAAGESAPYSTRDVKKSQMHGTAILPTIGRLAVYSLI
jgi:hypothetical protein